MSCPLAHNKKKRFLNALPEKAFKPEPPLRIVHQNERQVKKKMLQKQLLRGAKSIAVVGFSDKPHRESHRIGTYLMDYYTVYKVNPALVSSEEEEKKDATQGYYASLGDLPEKVDIVNVFRRSEFLDGVVKEAIEAEAGSVWAQTGVRDDDAKVRADEARLPMVMDTCIFLEHQELLKD